MGTTFKYSKPIYFTSNELPTEHGQIQTLRVTDPRFRIQNRKIGTVMANTWGVPWLEIDCLYVENFCRDFRWTYDIEIIVAKIIHQLSNSRWIFPSDRTNIYFRWLIKWILHLLEVEENINLVWRSICVLGGVHALTPWCFALYDFFTTQWSDFMRD